MVVGGGYEERGVEEQPRNRHENHEELKPQPCAAVSVPPADGGKVVTHRSKRSAFQGQLWATHGTYRRTLASWLGLGGGRSDERE